MKTDTILTVIIAALLTAAIIAGARYLNESGPYFEPKTDEATTWETLVPSDKRVPAGTAATRTSVPIKCHDPEIGEFWTNAATCEGADVHKRLSHAQLAPTTPAKDKYDDRSYVAPEDEAGNSRTDRKEPDGK